MRKKEDRTGRGTHTEIREVREQKKIMEKKKMGGRKGREKRVGGKDIRKDKRGKQSNAAFPKYLNFGVLDGSSDSSTGSRYLVSLIRDAES